MRLEMHEIECDTDTLRRSWDRNMGYSILLSERFYNLIQLADNRHLRDPSFKPVFYFKTTQKKLTKMSDFAYFEFRSLLRGGKI